VGVPPVLGVGVPLVAAPGRPVWRIYASAFFVAVTCWAMTMAQAPGLARRDRLSWFVGCSLVLWGASLVGTVVGYYAAARLPTASVADFGCGNVAWLSVLASVGAAAVFGVDGDKHAEFGGALHAFAKNGRVDGTETVDAAVAHEGFQANGAGVAQAEPGQRRGVEALFDESGVQRGDLGGALLGERPPDPRAAAAAAGQRAGAALCGGAHQRLPTSM
jgi:hypothetical protein